MKRTMIIRSVTLLLLLLSALMIYAQRSSASDSLDGLNAIVTRIESQIQTWSHEAITLLVLNILVVVLGALLAGLQKINKPWVAMGTVTAGIVISILTAVINTAFHDSYSGMRTKIEQSKQILDKLNISLTQITMSTSQEERRDQIRQIDSLSKEFHSLRQRSFTANIEIPLFPAAYAQTAKGQPDWIKKLPASTQTLYFMGVDGNTSYETAKGNSYRNAVQAATKYFSALALEKSTNIRSDSIANQLAVSIVKAGMVEDTYYKYSKPDSVYLFYTLFRIDRSLIEDNINLYELSEKLNLGADVRKAILSDPTERYYSIRIFDSYGYSLNNARQSLPESAYNEFKKGRQLRKDNQPQKAIAILKPFTQQNPGFYLGWYNLGLAYEAMNDEVNALSAYRKAADLNPSDVTLYNTYGFLLMINGKKQDAIRCFNKTLSIDPLNATAKNNLRLIKENGNQSQMQR